MKEMEMSWTCSMGHRVKGKSEDEIVKAAQEHMRKEHSMEISREEVLRSAKHEH